MTTGSASTVEAEGDTSEGVSAADAWRELRSDENIQFEPVNIPEVPPEPPGWFENFMKWLGEILSPLGQALGASWPVLKWVLLAAAIALILYLIIRTFGPMLGIERKQPAREEVEEWRPDTDESMALLEDADRLAAQGRYDEATHLLLKRSVGQIASARPQWVEPSSTARELAALAALPDAARAAFGVIAERVERSLFALRSLERQDWEAARSAYANFALAKIGNRQLDRVA